jgi:hypothetical protein
MTDPKQAIRTLCPHLTGDDLARAVQGARDDMAAAARLHAWLAARTASQKT